MPNTRYTFWIMGLTGRGFGVPSQAVNIITGHQGDIFFLNLYHCCQSLCFLELVQLNMLENLEDFVENACRKKMEVDKLTTIWQKRSRGPLLEDHTTY